MNRFDLSHQTAFVTGGAGLLGYQHAAALLENGAKVAIGDINYEKVKLTAEKLSQEFDSPVLALEVDVTNKTSVQSAHKAILEKWGKATILVNNAAIDPKVSAEGNIVETTRVENFPLEQWDLQLNVGLKGSFLCAQVFGSWMAENGGGVILNISSDLSVIAPDQRLYRKEGLAENQQPVKPVTYSVIKSALTGLTRYLAGYWSDKNIRVNALSPGGVFNNHPEEFLNRLTPLIPMGRMAHREEYRAAVQFLCSEASSYMTGQNVVIDGGRSIL